MYLCVGVHGGGGGLLVACVASPVCNQVACRWTTEPNTRDTRWNVSDGRKGRLVVL